MTAGESQTRESPYRFRRCSASDAFEDVGYAHEFQNQ